MQNAYAHRSRRFLVAQRSRAVCYNAKCAYELVLETAIVILDSKISLFEPLFNN